MGCEEVNYLSAKCECGHIRAEHRLVTTKKITRDLPCYCIGISSMGSNDCKFLRMCDCKEFAETFDSFIEREREKKDV